MQDYSILHGTYAAHYSGPVNGCAQRHEHGRWLQGCLNRGESPAQVLPFAHDRRWHNYTCAGFRHWGGRGGATGYWHSEATWRCRGGLRYSAGRQGAGGEPWR